MIQIRDLCFSIHNADLISGLSLAIGTGEKHLIIGKSGTGKTSLLKLLLGFARPDSGRIQINHLDVTGQNIRTIRQNVFYLSQDIDLPDEAGNDLLQRICRLNLGHALDMDALFDFFTLLSFSPKLLEKKVSRLSGGERQRLGLLMGLMLDRPIWLLDEPTAALDTAMKQTVSNHLMAMDKTMVIISHDPVWQTQPGIVIQDWH